MQRLLLLGRCALYEGTIVGYVTVLVVQGLNDGAVAGQSMSKAHRRPSQRPPMPHTCILTVEIDVSYLVLEMADEQRNGIRVAWPQKIATSAWSRPAPAKKILTGFLASFSQKQRTMAPLHGLTVISLLILAPFGANAFSVVDVASTGPRVAPFVALSAISTRRKMPSRNPRHGKDVVERVESIQQFKDVVINEPKRITVVRFFASYCKSCQASAPLFYKLAFRYAKHDSPLARNVKFVEVPLTKQTKLLHEALDIPSLPFSHIYHPDAGLCEELAVSKKHIADVDECLRCYVFGECQLPDDPNSCMEVYGECDLDDGSWE